MQTRLTLPVPSCDAKAHSQQVVESICTQIKQAGGQIPFSIFMQQALYAPGLGYYSVGNTKFGREGDFVTAPEISPLFGKSIANAISPILENLSNSCVFELGAGPGKLAATLLQQCPYIKTYYILEISAELRTRQQALFTQACPEQMAKIQWLDTLPTQPIQGVIIANEVMDALPATRFCWKNQQALEYYVCEKNQGFYWHVDHPSDAAITTFVENLQLTVDEYSSEIHLLLKPWIHSLSDWLSRGVILLFDYGFPRHEFYHPERSEGTLMCHYRHHAHSDPFFYPGLQDITAHIDFTAVAEAAKASQLHIAGYTTQAAFLLDNGILDIASHHDRHAIKILTFPSEMGELFKVMALSRGIDTPISGFRLQDLQHRL